MSYSNREIYNNALSLIGETTDEDYNLDYEQRAPYIIASFCAQVSAVDKRLRAIDGLGKANDFNRLHLDLDTDFPLCDKLLGCAALYLAAMLLSDYEYERSESFYDKYCDAIATLSASIDISSSDESVDTVSAVCEPIADRYSFD